MSQKSFEDQLKKKYGYGLFLRKQMDAKEFNLSDKVMNVKLQRAYRNKKLFKYKGVPGLYQCAKWTSFFGKSIPENKVGRTGVLDFLYMSEERGYQYGDSLLNKLGLTTQVPRFYMIATSEVKQSTNKNIENIKVKLTPVNGTINNKTKPLLAAIDTILQLGSTTLEGKSQKEVVTSLAKYAVKNQPSWLEIRRNVLSYSNEKIAKLIKVGFYDQLFRESNQLSAVG